MKSIMSEFHKGIEMIGGRKVIAVLDYSKGLDGLPKSDVLKYLLEGGCSVVVRPSGTEPKLKTYISVSADTSKAAAELDAVIVNDLQRYFV